MDEAVILRSPAPPIGGNGWWFRCPLVANDRPCGRQVRKLYLPPGARYFGCRYCHDLTYESCQESHKYDRLLGVVARDIGCDLGLVKRALG